MKWVNGGGIFQGSRISNWALHQVFKTGQMECAATKHLPDSCFNSGLLITRTLPSHNDVITHSHRESKNRMKGYSQA